MASCFCHGFGGTKQGRVERSVRGHAWIYGRTARCSSENVLCRGSSLGRTRGVIWRTRRQQEQLVPLNNLLGQETTEVARLLHGAESFVQIFHIRDMRRPRCV